MILKKKDKAEMNEGKSQQNFSIFNAKVGESVKMPD